MSYFLAHPDIFNLPFRLTKEEMNNPIQVLSDFFGDYSLGEVRHNLWIIGVACLTTDNIHFCAPDQRADLLTLIEKTEVLLEAVSVLVRQEESKT